ncbi:MAG: amidohydrolase [Clostridia bacterium]|nr:amidohydrolase [Clostridia bacterium]
MAGSLSSIQPHDLPVVDAHVHLFPDRLWRAIDAWFVRYGWELVHRGWDTEALVRYTLGRGLAGAFVLVYAHKPGMSRELNTWLAELTRSQPGFHGFATVHPDDEDLRGEAARCLDQLGLAGFKFQLGVQRFRADDPRVFPVYEVLEARGRPVVIHAGLDPYGPEYGDVLGARYLGPVLARFPRLRVVVPHLGLPELDAFLELAARYPGLYLDLAAIDNPRVHTPWERLREVLITFQDRILFGTDFPIRETPPDHLLERLLALDLPDPVRRKILCDNALSLVGTRP